MCIYIYIYTCRDVSLSIKIHIYIYIYTYIYIYMHIHVCMSRSLSGPHSSVVSARAQVAEALGSSPAETVRGHTTKTE